MSESVVIDTNALTKAIQNGIKNGIENTKTDKPLFVVNLNRKPLRKYCRKITYNYNGKIYSDKEYKELENNNFKYCATITIDEDSGHDHLVQYFIGGNILKELRANAFGSILNMCKKHNCEIGILTVDIMIEKLHGNDFDNTIEWEEYPMRFDGKNIIRDYRGFY